MYMHCKYCKDVIILSSLSIITDQHGVERSGSATASNDRVKGSELGSL